MLQCLLFSIFFFRKGLHFTAVQQVREGLVAKQCTTFVKQENVKQIFSLSVGRK